MLSNKVSEFATDIGDISKKKILGDSLDIPNKSKIFDHEYSFSNMLKKSGDLIDYKKSAIFQKAENAKDQKLKITHTPTPMNTNKINSLMADYNKMLPKNFNPGLVFNGRQPTPYYEFGMAGRIKEGLSGEVSKSYYKLEEADMDEILRPFGTHPDSGIPRERPPGNHPRSEESKLARDSVWVQPLTNEIDYSTRATSDKIHGWIKPTNEEMIRSIPSYTAAAMQELYPDVQDITQLGSAEQRKVINRAKTLFGDINGFVNDGHRRADTNLWVKERGSKPEKTELRRKVFDALKSNVQDEKAYQAEMNRQMQTKLKGKAFSAYKSAFAKSVAERPSFTRSEEPKSAAAAATTTPVAAKSAIAGGSVFTTPRTYSTTVKKEQETEKVQSQPKSEVKPQSPPKPEAKLQTQPKAEEKALTEEDKARLIALQAKEEKSIVQPEEKEVRAPDEQVIEQLVSDELDGNDSDVDVEYKDSVKLVGGSESFLDGLTGERNSYMENDEIRYHMLELVKAARVMYQTVTAAKELGQEGTGFKKMPDGFNAKISYIVSKCTSGAAANTFSAATLYNKINILDEIIKGLNETFPAATPTPATPAGKPPGRPSTLAAAAAAQKTTPPATQQTTKQPVTPAGKGKGKGGRGGKGKH